MGLMCANRDCYREVSEEALRQLPGIKCPHCGQRILFKKRPQVIKRVKALWNQGIIPFFLRHFETLLSI